MSPARPIHLALVCGRTVARTWVVHAESVDIGSGPGCHLRVGGEGLAPVHATLYVDEGELCAVPGQGGLTLDGVSVDFAVPGPDNLLGLGPLTLRASLSPLPSPADVSASGGLRIALMRGGRVVRTWDVHGAATVGSAEGNTIRAAGDPDLAPVHATLLPLGDGVCCIPHGDAALRLDGEPVHLALVDPTSSLRLSRVHLRAERIRASYRPVLRITTPSGRSKDLPLRTGRYSIGSAKSAIKLGFPGISPLHATLVVGESGAVAVVAEEGSEVLVDGVAVTRAGLASGSVVQVGPVQLVARDCAPPVVPIDAVRPSIPDEQHTEYTSGVPVVGDLPPDEPTEIEDLEELGELEEVEPEPMPGTSEASGRKPFAAGEGTVRPGTSEASGRKPFAAGEGTVRPEPEPGTSEASGRKPFAAGEGTVRPAEDDVAAAPLWDPDDWVDPEEDDEDEDQEHWVEPFDLAELLFHGDAPAQEGARAGFVVAQIVRVVEGTVVETTLVTADEPWASRDSAVVCGVDGERVVLILGEEVKGDVVGPEPRAVAGGEVVLAAGEAARLWTPTGSLRVDAGHPPRRPVSYRLPMGPLLLVLLPVAFGLHLLFAMGVLAVNPAWQEAELVEDEEIFAEVLMDAPEAKEPEKPPPTVLAISEKAPDITARTMTELKEELAARPRETDVDTLLTVLAQGSGKMGASDSLKDNLSNIDAVPGGGPGQSGFDIAGAIGKLDGGVNIAREGGGGPLITMSGDQVGDADAKLASSGRGGNVRGQVTKVNSQVKVQGHLSKEAVSRVVNDHTHEVQGCYERQLLKQQGLAGRIVFEWTVTMDGSVRNVRVASSTVPSPEVADCIVGKIRKWRFPAPDGDEVVISYPFLFRSVGG